MSKNSEPEAPQYQFKPTTITQNGQTVASNTYDPTNGWNVSYNLSDEDLARKNNLKNQLQMYEQNINAFSPQIQRQFEDIAGARRDKAIDQFNDIYEPSERQTREDYFSRLGTLDSTAYLDRQNDLEKTKANAYSDIAKDYVANLDSLKQNELANRYQYLNYLNSGISGYDALANAYTSAIANMGNAYNSGLNNFNLSNYQNQLAQYNSTKGGNSNLYSAIGGTLGAVGGTLLAPGAGTVIGASTGTALGTTADKYAGGTMNGLA